MFVLLSLSILLLAFLFTLWPTLRGAGGPRLTMSPSDTPLGRLALRKEILLENITDLDFEYAMGKLAEEDYLGLRETLKQQAAQVMEQMDVIGEGMATAETEEEAAAPARFCTACGHGIPGAARFCPACGEKVVW